MEIHVERLVIVPPKHRATKVSLQDGAVESDVLGGVRPPSVAKRERPVIVSENLIEIKRRWLVRAVIGG